MARSKSKHPAETDPNYEVVEYCTHCGKQCIAEWRGRYFSTSGEKITYLVCPDKPCEHGYEGHLYVVKKTKLLWIIPWQIYECQRCGDKASYYFDGRDWI